MKKYFSYVSLVFVLLLKYLFHTHPKWTELYYSSAFYAVISRFLRLLFGWIPFSFGDILYTVIGLYVFYFVFRYFKKIWKMPLWFLKKSTQFLSVVIVFFYILWGFNYSRVPISKQLKIRTSYSEEQLFRITEHFIDESNCLHSELVENDTLAVISPYATHQILKKSVQAYKNLSIFYPQWDYSYASVKTSIYSEILSYMGYSGYLNPFTNEAQINARMPFYQKPITTCHEMAHQLGYSAEQEANFIGYLACLYSRNRYFNYCASLFALRYCLLEVRKLDANRYQNYIGKIHKGVLKNFQESNEFWRVYINPFNLVFEETYNAYLKANQQSKGVKSYSLVVGLLIGYYWSES